MIGEKRSVKNLRSCSRKLSDRFVIAIALYEAPDASYYGDWLTHRSDWILRKLW